MTEFDASFYTVKAISKKDANETVIKHHYLHRRPSNSHSFGLISKQDRLDGVVVFGVPASRHAQKSCWPENPNGVLELTRLWVDDRVGRNAESYLVANSLAQLDPRIIISYADTRHGHTGVVYRALNFKYAGWTDMERKTPRLDYIVPDNGHTRDAFRNGVASYTHTVRRKPKAKYWITTGTKRDRRYLESICKWPSLDWREHPVPFEHEQFQGTTGSIKR
jgi:hypothetical protein